MFPRFVDDPVGEKGGGWSGLYTAVRHPSTISILIIITRVLGVQVTKVHWSHNNNM